MSFEIEPWSQFLERTTGAILRNGITGVAAYEDAFRTAAALHPALCRSHSAA